MTKVVWVYACLHPGAYVAQVLNQYNLMHPFINQYYWLYAAVEPATGEGYWWELPHLNSTCFELFLQQMSQYYANSLNIIVLDNAPAHTAKSLILPDNILLLWLPPYSPELNPVERLWQDIKQQIDVFDERVRTSLDGLREHVGRIIRRYCPLQLQSLIRYDFIKYALNALK